MNDLVKAIFGCFFIFRFSFVYGDEKKTENRGWEVLARKSELTSDEISKLMKYRILITNKEYKQIFSAYIGGHIPKFITLDSILSAYHVRFEESVVSLEKARASQLQKFLKLVLSSV